MNFNAPEALSDDELADETADRPKRLLVIHEQVIADLNPYTPDAAAKLLKRWEENGKRREALIHYRACRAEIVKRAAIKKAKVETAAKKV